MGTIQHYATDSVEPAMRSRFWDHVIGQNFAGGSVMSRREALDAEFWRWPLNDLEIARARSNRSLVSRWRTEKPRDSTGPSVMIHVQNAGFSDTRQGGGAALIARGEMAICDARAPYTVDISDRNDILVMEIPLAMLGDPDPSLIASCRKLGREVPAVSVLRRYILSLYEDYSGQVDADEARAHSEIVLKLIACILRRQPLDRSSRGQTRIERIVAWIEEHLHVPELTVGAIADCNHCSPRTVQALFAQLGTTPSRYVMRRRLERAKAMLGNPALADRTITDIALDVGFNDSGYFSRTFRRKFGVPPRTLR